MGQARRRKAEIMELKAKAKSDSIVVMPLQDDKLYNNSTPGAYIEKNGIKNAIIVGQVFNMNLGMPIKVAVLVTTNVRDQEAQAFGKTWWGLEENKGPKFMLWFPLNDMKEMTASGLEKLGQGHQGQMTSNLIDLLGLEKMFKKAIKTMCEKDPSYIKAFNNLGKNFGDMIIATN